MEDNVISASDMIAKLFANLAPQAAEANKVVNAWKSTVSKVHGVGEQLAAHTRVIDIKDGVLSIETDHPSWSQLLQLHSDFILKGLTFKIPEMEVRTLVFRIAK